MRRALISITSIIILVFLDLISKYFFHGIFQEIFLQCYDANCTDTYYPIFSNWLGILPAHNTGIAFSFPITWLPLQIATLVIMGVIIYYYIHEEYPKQSRLLDIGYILIIAGALSHAYERIFIWHVIDFIFLKYFAIFNFADIFISVWAFLIILFYVLTRKHR